MVEIYCNLKSIELEKAGSLRDKRTISVRLMNKVDKTMEDLCENNKKKIINYHIVVHLSKQAYCICIIRDVFIIHLFGSLYCVVVRNVPKSQNFWPEILQFFIDFVWWNTKICNFSDRFS